MNVTQAIKSDEHTDTAHIAHDLGKKTEASLCNFLSANEQDAVHDANCVQRAVKAIVNDFIFH